MKLQATQYLKATGLLDGYEAVIDRLVTQGWPADKNIFDHASYELLKWHAEHKEEYSGLDVVNPGVMGLVSSGFKQQNFESEE